MRKFIILALSAALLSFAAAAFAGPSLKVESLNYTGAQEDEIGRRGGSPDGTKDAEFTVAVSGAQAIKSITLRNETTGEEWSSSGRRNFLLVKNAKGEVVNEGGNMKPVPVLLVTKLTLVVNDAAEAIPEDSRFTATVEMIGGETSSASTEAAAVRSFRKPGKDDRDKKFRDDKRGGRSGAKITAKYTGVGKYDFAGQKERAAANMNPDSFIELSISGADSAITGISVTNARSGKTWDTIPGNGNPAAVILSGRLSSPKKLNNKDGSISIKPGQAKKLYVAFDEDKKGRGGAQYTVCVLFEDGQLAEVKAGK